METSGSFRTRRLPCHRRLRPCAKGAPSISPSTSPRPPPDLAPPPPAQAHIKKTYGEGLDEKMVKEMVQEADTNQDGEVDLEEFKAIMRAGL